MERATIANFFYKAAEALVRQLDKLRDRHIQLEDKQIERIGNYLERISVVLLDTADTFEKGQLPYSQCAELESVMNSATSVVLELSERLSDLEIDSLMERLEGGVNAPFELSSLVEKYQQRSLLIYFHSPNKDEKPTTLDAEMALLRAAAGYFRGAAEKVRLGA